MLDPFSLLPLAMAARGGTVDDFEVQQLVAAGLTLLQRSAPLVRSLSGKRAAILLPTSPAFFTALAACEGRGAVLIDPLAAPPEILHQITDASVGAVFTTSTRAGGVPAGTPCVLMDDAPRTATVVVDGAPREIDLGSHVGMSLEGDADAPGRNDEAAIVYTSAMAGIPLGAILTHENLLANARASMQAAKNTSDDRVLAVLPFSHLFGLTVTAAAPLLAGGHVVTMSKFNALRAAQLIASGTITEVVGVPAVFRAIAAALEKRDAGIGALRLCVCGGAPLSEAFQDRWATLTGVELRQGYGLTEAGPVCLANSVDAPNVRGSLGRPLPGVEIDLRTPITYDALGVPTDGADIHRDDEGEICVRGASVFRGYVSGGERGLPIRDGWLHTGDLGRRDAAGNIHFAGIVKPMFTRNGFNIYPHEIEHAVAAMPLVVDVTAREVAVPEREPEIALTVVGNVSADDVKQWCAEHLSAHKQPASVTLAPLLDATRSSSE